MTTIHDGTMWVHYGQAYVQGDVVRSDEINRAFEGQANGLCGAAERENLVLMTGLHTGVVGMRVDIVDAAPPLGDEWEEIVEVSFRPHGDVRLVDWNRNLVADLSGLSGPQRVRYCARNMDAAGEQDTIEGPDPIDHYALIFWPGPDEPDRIVRQHSEQAEYYRTAWTT